MTVGCLVMQGYNVVANTTRTIRWKTNHRQIPRLYLLNIKVVRLLPRKEDSYSRPPGPQTYPRPTSTGISRGGRQVGSFHEHRTHLESVPCHSYLLLEQTIRGSLLRGRLGVLLSSCPPVLLSFCPHVLLSSCPSVTLFHPRLSSDVLEEIESPTPIGTDR